MKKTTFNFLSSIGFLSVFGGTILATDVFAGKYIVKQENGVTSATTQTNNDLPDDSSIDYRNAEPMAMPTIPVSSINSFKAPKTASSSEKPGSSPGNMGTGKGSPTKVPQSKYPSLNQEEGLAPQGSAAAVVPQAFGSAAHAFSTARVANSISNKKQDKAYKSYPYRAAGKLFFNRNDGSSSWCSAALIKPGIIVTAAHCVVRFGAGGEEGFYSNWVFIPAYHNGEAPFGKWYGFAVSVLASFAYGTDSLDEGGPPFRNDVAVIAVSDKKRKQFPGTRTGWFGYRWNGYGFTTNFPGFPDGITQISQLGYPADLDNGEQMQRNDAAGYKDTNLANNTIIGTLMTGGSSGGPWVVNLGTPPKLTPVEDDIDYGSDALYNQIVGVTSWGWSDLGIKEQGASPFTSSNIASLVNSICSISELRHACTH